MIQPRDQVTVEPGQTRVHVGGTGDSVYLVLRSAASQRNSWTVLTLEVTGEHEAYIPAAGTIVDAFNSWLTEETTVLT